MTIYDDAVEAGKNASRAVVEQALAEREAQAAAYKSERDAANLKGAELTSRLAATEEALTLSVRKIDELNKEIERLKTTSQPSPEPVPNPEPSKPKTLYGSCLINGGSMTDVAKKFGGRPVVRNFIGGTVSWSPAPANTPVHRSWKPGHTITDATIDAMLKAADADAAKNGVVHVVTFWHESDNDGLSAEARATRINLQNRLYERKQALGLKNVLVSVVFTGGFFASYGTQANRDLWKNVKGDLVGVDMDGLHTVKAKQPNPSTYVTEYDDETANVLKFMEVNKANGWIGWTVPEFGTSRQNYFDPDGTKRAAWFEKWAKHFEDNGAYHVILFDYDTPAHPGPTDNYNSVKAGTPELEVWKRLVAKNS